MKLGICETLSLAVRWVQSVPHPPSKELKDTLYNAAFHHGAHGLHASTGMAIVTTGDQRTAIEASAIVCESHYNSIWLVQHPKRPEKIASGAPACTC